MNCNQTQPDLLDYSRGLLNPRLAEGIRAHLESCAECRAVLESEIGLVKRLSVMPSTVAPKSDVWPLVHERIDRVRKPFGVFDLIFGTPVRKAASAAAALAMLLIVLLSATMWNTNMAERQSIAQAREIMRVQPVAQQASTWTDDPLAGTTDAMMQVLEDETRPE